MSEHPSLFPNEPRAPRFAPVTQRRLEIMLAYAAQGRMTDAALGEYLARTGAATDNGPRSRRSELVESHLVERVGERFNDAGNRVLVWDLSQEGRNYLEGLELWTFRT